MNKIVSIFAIISIVISLALAETPSGASAFFLQSDFGYSSWIHNDHDTLQSLQTDFVTATKFDAGIFALGVSSARTTAQTKVPSAIPDSIAREIHLRLATPEFFAGWSTPLAQTKLQETMFMSDANHYGASLASQWRISTWTVSLQSNAETRLNAFWNWQDYLFAGQAKEVGGDWSSRALQLRSGATWRHDLNTASAELEIVKTTPAPMFAHWGLRDSSLWVQAAASFTHSWNSWDLQASASSLSGSLQLQGLRTNLGDEKLFMLMNTGWDVNTIWLNAFPRNSSDACRASLPMSTPITPWQKLLAKAFSQSHAQCSFGLGYTWARANLFSPNSDASERTFWGNRLFDPSMVSLVGYSVFKKELSLSGTGDLRAYHFQIALPWWGNHIGGWASVVGSHWQVNAQEQGKITVKSVVGETHTPLWGALQLDGILAQVSTGIRWRASLKSPWVIYCEAQQLVPYLYHMDLRNQDDVAPISLPSGPIDTTVAPIPLSKKPAWHYKGEGLSLHIGVEHLGW